MALDKDGHGSFHEFTGYFGGNKSRTENDATDFFVGRFKEDNLYHLLGHRPKSCAYLFPAESESRSNLGIVQLPNGRNNLSELEKGDALTVTPIPSSAEPRGADVRTKLKKQRAKSYEIIFEKFNS